MAKKQECHWYYEGKPVLSLADMPYGVLGFVYEIFNENTKRTYLGKKSVVKKATKVKGSVDKYYPWLSYVGSNKTLIAEFKSGHILTKRILYYCFTKSELSYMEAREIMCSSSLEDPAYYNDWCYIRTFKRYLKQKPNE